MKSHVCYQHQKAGEFRMMRVFALIIYLLGIFFSATAYSSAADKDILSADERLWLTNNQSRLILAVETGYAPFVFLDSEDQPTGLAHDYMRLIETKLGVHFNQKQFSSLDDIFQEVRSGKAHIVNAVTSTPARTKFLSITDHFISVPNVIVVRKEHPGQVSDRDFSGLKVSLVKSYAITEHMTKGDLHFIPDLVPDDLAALLNVSFGRSDAAVIDLATASYLISEKGITNLRVAGDVAYDIRLSIGTPLNEPMLFGILQKGLSAISDAERKEIRNRWINASEDQSIFKDRQLWSVLGGAIAIAFVILAIIFLRNRSLRLQAALPLLILLSGLAVTYFLQQAALTNMHKTHQVEFDSQAREIVLRIVNRLEAYAQVLRGTKGMFVASKRVERDAFRDYVANLRLADIYPGIQGVGFSQIIPPQEKDRHVKTFRKEGFPNYELWPEGERDLYTSIVYLEPFAERNLRAFGYDMYSEPVRRAAMEMSRDLEQSVMSGKVLLVQETGQKVQAGFLIYVPVYRNGSPHATQAERRANIIGWAYSPFRMNDLMLGILGNQANNVSIKIYDGKKAAPETQMYDSDAEQSEAATPLYDFSQHIEILGHEWTVKLHTLPGFEARLDTGWVTMIRLSGILMSVLLSLLVWQLATSRMRALSLAQEMTKDLQESKFRWKFAIEGSGDGLWDWNVADSTVFFSKRWKEMLGHSEDEVGNSLDEWAKRVHPEDKVAILGTVQDYLDGKTPIYQNEHRVQCKDGSYKWILDRGMVVSRTEDGKPLRIIGTHTDITERKEHEEELLRSNAELEQFSYAISHDMRQPLRMISSYLQLLERSLADQLDAEKREYFNFAIDGAKRIDQMLMALLEYSRVGRKGEPPTLIESRAVLDEALQFLQPAIAEAQAKLTISGDWPCLMGCHDEIQRLIQNLIGNAVKYRIAGRTPEITVSSKMVKNEWHLSVSDNGVGILPDQIERLFKVFQRLHTRAAYEGTGIGLALCRKIAEHQKGRIWAESEGEGQGSKFCVVIPCGGG